MHVVIIVSHLLFPHILWINLDNHFFPSMILSYMGHMGGFKDFVAENNGKMCIWDTEMSHNFWFVAANLSLTDV